MVYPAQVLTSRLQRQQLGLWLRASSLLFSTSNGMVHLRCTASLILTYEFDSLRTLSYSVQTGASSLVPSLTWSKLHALVPDAREWSSSLISYLHSGHHLSDQSGPTATITSGPSSQVNQSSTSHHRINRPLARDDHIQGETQGPQGAKRVRDKRFSLPPPHHTRVSSSIHSLSNHHGQQIHHSSTSTSPAKHNNRTRQHHQHHHHQPPQQQRQQQEKQLRERHLTARSSQLHSASHHEINGNPSGPGNSHRPSSFNYNSSPSDRDSGLFFMNSGNRQHLNTLHTCRSFEFQETLLLSRGQLFAPSSPFSSLLPPLLLLFPKIYRHSSHAANQTHRRHLYST